MLARQFSGTGYGRIAGSLIGQDTGTFAAWIYKNSNTAWLSVFDADTVRHALAFESATQVDMYSDGRNTTRTVSVTNSVWTHIAWRYNKTGNIHEFLVNGSAASLNAASGTWGTNVVGTYGWIGAKYNATQLFDGAMAWPALWTTALSDGDVLSLAAGADPSTIATGSFVDRWEFTGASPEVGVNANNMTMLGTSTTIDGPTFGATFVPQVIMVL